MAQSQQENSPQDAGHSSTQAPAASGSASRPPLPYDVLTDLIIGAPGRSAVESALATLRQLASDGDFAAVLGMSQLVAHELGFDAATPGLRESRSLTELLSALETAPLVRLYTLGFLPRQLLVDPSTASELAREALAADYLPRFQALVRRNAPIQHEVLKAYVLLAFAGLVLARGWRLGATGLAILDQVLQNAKVVPGNAADTKFEFGRDFILARSEAVSLIGTITHEIAHHLLDSMAAGRMATDPSDTAEILRSLSGALPGLMRAAAAAGGQPRHAGDAGRWRSASGLSVVCTWHRLPDGAYAHFSLTDAGGPIHLPTASMFAYFVLRLLGADPARAAAAYSSRGVFHFGIEGTLPDPDQVGAHARRADRVLLELASVADAWFADLQRAGRVGAAETDIRYILGVAQRPPTFYGLDADVVWRDHSICGQILAGADLAGLSEPTLLELLRLAVRCGDPSSVRRVLAAGACPNPTDPGGAGLRDLGRSCGILREGPDVTYLGPRVPDLFAVLAALRGAGFDLDQAITEGGDTLLTDAAARSAELVASLVSIGATVDRPNAHGETALAVAAALANAGIAEWLLDAGASVATRDDEGGTPLHRAASRGDRELLALLLDRGSDPDAGDNSGVTPLMEAAGRGAAAIVRDLLAAGADPNATTDLGEAALHFVLQEPWHAEPLGTTADQMEAAEIAERRKQGALGTIEALLDAGADVDEESNRGITPLIAAVQRADADLVACLIDHGAQVHLRTVNGNTALIFASQGGQEQVECVRLLVAAGADINTTNDDGETALHRATTGANPGLVSLLLELGADPNIRSRSGVTPLAIARSQGDRQSAEDLVAAGADVDETGTGR